MKEYKVTIIAVIAIIIAIAAFITVKSIANKNEENEIEDISEDEDQTVTIMSFSPYNVSKLTIHNEEDIEVVRISEDSWTCTTHPDLDIYDTSMYDILTVFGSLNGLVVVDGAKEEINYKNFGLSEEDSMSWARVLLKDGTIHTVWLGKNNLSGSRTYIKVDDKDVVYSVSTTYSDDLLATRSSFIYLYPFKFADTDKVNSLKMYKSNEIKFYAIANYESEEKAWDLTKPVIRSGDASNINTLVSSLVNIKINSIVETDCENLSLYGLDVPDTSYVMGDSTGVTKTVHIGDKTADEEYYYCLFNDGNDVYTVETSYFTYKDTDLLSFMDVYPFLEQYTGLKRIDVYINDEDGEESHVMEINTIETSKKDEDGNIVKDENGDPEYETTEELKFDDKEVDDESRGTYIDDDGEEEEYPTQNELFKKVITALYSVKMTALELEQGEIGETVLKIVYTRTDDTTVTVECKKRNDTTMYIYCDGNYIGGYGKISRVSDYSMEYSIRNTINNLTDTLK